MKRILLLGATGNTGRVFLDAAVARKHSVTCFVRDASKLAPSSHVRVIQGSIDDSSALQHALQDHDVVVNCAGYVADENFGPLVKKVMDAVQIAAPACKFWFFGGAAVLDVPGYEPLKMVRTKRQQFPFLVFFKVGLSYFGRLIAR